MPRRMTRAVIDLQGLLSHGYRIPLFQPAVGNKGVGMGRAACFMGDTNPNLVRLPGSEPILKYDIWVLTHPDLHQQPKVKLLMQFLIDALLNKKGLIEGIRQP